MKLFLNVLLFTFVGLLNNNKRVYFHIFKNLLNRKSSLINRIVTLIKRIVRLRCRFQSIDRVLERMAFDTIDQSVHVEMTADFSL
jgi:hypothetical protein